MSDSDDDVAGDDNAPQATNEDQAHGSQRYLAPRAAKSKAGQAWDELKPRSRKRQSEHDKGGSQPKDNQRARNEKESVQSAGHKSASNSTFNKKYRAPDIGLDSDDDDDNNNDIKASNSKAPRVSKKSQKDEDEDQNSPRPAKKSNIDKKSSNLKKPDSRSDSSESSKDSYKPQDGDEDLDSTEESGLEELEKNKKALERQFRHEAPAWADEPDDGLVDDDVDAFSASHNFPPPETDPGPSDDDADKDDRPRGEHHRQKSFSSNQTSQKKRAKGSTSSESEGSDIVEVSHILCELLGRQNALIMTVVKPPPKKKKSPSGDKSRPLAKVAPDASETHREENTGHRSSHGGSRRPDGSSRGSALGLQSGRQKGSNRDKARVDKTHGKVEAVAAQPHKSAAPSNSQIKRKRIKVDENVSWVDGSDAENNADPSSRVKRRRAQEVRLRDTWPHCH
ncbi:hypothetical protein K466DRAFT_607432 [Polyporus arcularius HHB13444]|uniref:Uncharacterized protein n=1 Tax=Polyporus arcularius HHB13444 TaxID=1314778 RepID=A0A5C3NMV1_9APHY|nr:hypothetical protein K466DRAFT_607432 [Polyporus arcularius HHB13444]